MNRYRRIRCRPLIVVLAVAGCQPLPHPFERDGVPPTAVALQLPGAAGVAITPVSGLSSDAGETLARTMAKALTQYDIPASLGAGNRASLRLSGRAEPLLGSPPNAITWSLAGPDGAPLGTDIETGAAPAAEWASGTGPALDLLTGASAGRVARLIEGPDAAPEVKPGDAKPGETGGSKVISVRVDPPPDAPGDGRASLTAALRHALVDAGYRPTDTGAAVIVRGEVVLASSGAHQHIRIIWHVLRASGEQQAEIAQENDIATGSLDHGWGPIASDIVAAAIPDLTPLIDATARL